MPECAFALPHGEDPILVDDHDGIRTVILNRPEARNAMNRAMRTEFARLMARTAEDPLIGAVILTGASNCFSAGVDLKDRPAGALPIKPDPAHALRSLGKPVIAAVDGPCMTGALEMALSCTVVLATPTAHFADTHCRVGFVPRWGGGALLTRTIGVRRAAQLMLTGERIDAAHALAWGLVNEIVEPAMLIARARELAGAMIAHADDQPFAFGLHMRFLRDVAAGKDPSVSEAAMLARFDNVRNERVATKS